MNRATIHRFAFRYLISSYTVGIFWLSKRFHANASLWLWHSFNGISHHNFMSNAALLFRIDIVYSAYLPINVYHILRWWRYLVWVNWYCKTSDTPHFDKIIQLIEFCWNKSSHFTEHLKYFWHEIESIKRFNLKCIEKVDATATCVDLNALNAYLLLWNDVFDSWTFYSMLGSYVFSSVASVVCVIKKHGFYNTVPTENTLSILHISTIHFSVHSLLCWR